MMLYKLVIVSSAAVFNSRHKYYSALISHQNLMINKSVLRFWHSQQVKN